MTIFNGGTFGPPPLLKFESLVLLPASSPSASLSLALLLDALVAELDEEAFEAGFGLAQGLFRSNVFLALKPRFFDGGPEDFPLFSSLGAEPRFPPVLLFVVSLFVVSESFRFFLLLSSSLDVLGLSSAASFTSENGRFEILALPPAPEVAALEAPPLWLVSPSAAVLFLSPEDFSFLSLLLSFSSLELELESFGVDLNS